MRSARLVPTLAVAAGLLSPAPAAWANGREAVKHPSPNGRCAVNINVAPEQITAGDSVVAFGQLRCRDQNQAAGQTVSLLERATATPGFGVVQTSTTSAQGFYEFTVGLEANSDFYVRSHGAASGRRTVKVGAQVTLSGPPEGTQIFTGRPSRVTFTGTVSPIDIGALVVLQRQNAVTGNEWHRIDLGRVTAAGTFSITHTFVAPGDANIRVLVRSDGLSIPSASTPLEYEISQTQNPSLEISSSADPISYGQSVSISGVLAGATTPQTVTLETRTVHQQGFAPVAEVSTGAGGAYNFPAQSPLNSTLYRVKGAGQKSAVLYEGVKDVLTAEVSASTVKAGEALTFKGTVAPDHSGHIIYLERQNAAGTGFHVVQISYVLPGSTYSIVHQVYVPGTKIYRIDIPGGPDNGRAVSQLFTIQVTPAPASAIKPEAPNNSSQPPAGQTEGSEVEKPLTE